MTKKELIEALADVPDEFMVVLSSDAEGNSYSPLAGYATVCYVAETPYSGEIYDEESAEEMEVNFIENAVALWPTN
jgi:hypothetical protein